MQFKLMCEPDNNKKLQKAFEKAGFTINPEGNFIITENNHLGNYIPGKQNETIFMVDLTDICYFESYGNEVFLVKDDNSRYTVNQRLFELENQLINKGFLRINKSQIVNIKHINEIIPWFSMKFLLQLKNKTTLDVNRSYYKNFKSYFNL